MGFVDVAGVRHTLPDGRVLLDDVSFRVGEGARAALVGENGAGKTTLLRIIAGDLVPEAGSVARAGGLGVMRQFIGSVRDDTTVQRFLVDLSPPAVRAAWDSVEAAELRLMETDEEPAQLAYATALGHWGDVGGYDAEVTWDTATVAALGVPYEGCKYRELSSLSGGEHRSGVERGRAMAALRRYGLAGQGDQPFRTLSGGQQARFQILLLELSGATLLLLDEPTDNLDVLSAEALEEALAAYEGTVLAVTHDRWFARSFDRFLVFGADGRVYESAVRSSTRRGSSGRGDPVGAGQGAAVRSA